MTNARAFSTKLQISSSAFAEGQPIPARYTCDGEDVSPPLRWGKVPDKAKSLALICDDPDAPGGAWVHWVIYNIATATSELEEGVPTTETIEGLARQGKNDFGKIGYGGPCPPRGPAHRYFFKLYALDAELELRPGATRNELMSAIKNHIVAQGETMGTYKRV